MEEVGYKRLHVWKESHELVLMVYEITKKFPKDELFGLVSQIRRAAVSIPANIVEGYARTSKKELAQFLSVSRGSLAEVEYYLFLSKELRYLSPAEYEKIENKRIIVGKLLNGFVRSLN